MKLSNRVALITGSGSGIGRASAILFSQEGAKICVVDIDIEAGNQTVEIIKEKGGQAICIKADVSQEADVEMMVKTTVHTYGGIDIMFNNAGIPMNPIPIEDVKEDYWNRIMNINLKSVFLCTKYVVPIMKKQGKGVIINTASAQGVRPSLGRNAYCASKAAVIQLTKAVALEVAQHNIRVNCINPIATNTPMLPKFIDESGPADEKWEEAKRSLIAAVPLGRIATPEDIAYAALFLATDDSAFLTGTGLDIDGGRLI